MMRKRKGRVIPAIAFSILMAAAVTAPATTICDVQAYDENWASPLVGETVTVQGTVIIPPGYYQPLYSSFYIEADGCGVNIFDYDPVPFEVELGDTIQITGVVTEYNGTTEIVYSSISMVAQGTSEPEPTYMSLRDISAEENEGRLLRTIGVVTSQSPWYFYIDQPWSGAEVQVYQSNPEVNIAMFDIGDTVDVTGILLQYDRDAPYTEGWELAPRWDEDMKLAEAPPPEDPEFWPGAALGVPPQVFRPDVGEVLPITYLAPERSTATMEIYDLQGRVVRTLADGEYTGYSEIPETQKDDFYVEGVRGWDGRDELRRVVPAGVYICRLQVEDRDGMVSVSTAPIVVGIKLDK